VPFIDQSGLYALEDSVFDLRKRGIEVILTAPQEQPLDMLKGIDIIPDLIPEHDVFETIEGAFTYLRKKL